MDSEPKPAQVTKQPEPTTEMTAKHGPMAVSNEIEQPSGQVHEHTSSKKKRKGCCPAVPVVGVDGLCTIIVGGLCCLCQGLS
ncbi:hypothetical protein RSOLAG22IIIB_10892 [Rhizoctonia solani]|uniref:Uncharacterized protein n=1 Tax=Rhizoctonia solani TaxID=456999 RepID=A0A0K6G4U2_9AGAM|nr:hypothetical protein RSOLAG22IIIB_10892 [Rhizoctonia solani]